MAEEKKLHLVEFSKANNFFPNVVASPQECRKQEEIPKDELLDYKQYCLDGRVILQKKKWPPFYSTYYSYHLYLKKREKLRNQDAAKQNLIAKYGELRSFLADQYPECRKYSAPKKDKPEEA